ncbi:phage tail protein, partial [Escherichia coli]
AGTVQTFTSARNSWHTSIMPVYNAPQPTYLWAAAVGAQTAQHFQAPPELSRPLQTVELIGILPPKSIGDQWSTLQRQSFYFSGASGYRVQDGAVQIDRLITTYQRNAWGSPDQSWLNVNTIAQLTYGLRYIMAYMTQTYPRAALVDKNPNNLQGFATADDLKNAFIHAYKLLEDDGVFENSDLFAQLLIVERNADNPDRVDTFLPLDHVNQLRVLAVNATSY